MAIFKYAKAPASFRRREMTIKPDSVSCGEFTDLDLAECENSGTALAPEGLPFVQSMFTMRCRGNSIEPKIRDRMWCLFHPDVGGTRQGRIVLVEETGRKRIRSLHAEAVPQLPNLRT